MTTESEAVEAEQTEPAADAEHQDADPANREAANYRRKLRDTEAERDSLSQRVTALQRSTVESLLRTEHVSPNAVFALTELADLLDDNGIPDPQKVRAAAQSARQQLGLDRGLYVPAEGHVPPTHGKRSFRSAFQPPTHR